MLRLIKIDNGMTGEFTIIATDAPDVALTTQLKIRMEKEQKGELLDDEWAFLVECGHFVGIFGCSDDGNMDDFDFSKIDATFNHDDYLPADDAEYDNPGKIFGIVSDYGNGNYGYWRNFTLSEEDEFAIREILSKCQ